MTEKPLDKPFATYDEQIEKLITKKIAVANKDTAINVLKKISYFALVNGYKDIFKDKSVNKYYDKVCFEDLLTLYEFDQNLRQLLIRYILIVERHLKSSISYHFSEKFKNSHSEYLNVNNYNYENAELRLEINRLVMILSNIIRHQEENYIKHNLTKYKNVPLWVLINALTLGNISKMYSLMQQGVQIKICGEFKNIKRTTDLKAMLRILTMFRNVCAHNERLYNYSLQKDSLPNLSVHSKLGIKSVKGQYSCGRNDLFAVVISFKYILADSDFNTFYKELEILVEQFELPSKAVSKIVILDKMGFPENWKGIKEVAI